MFFCQLPGKFMRVPDLIGNRPSQKLLARQLMHKHQWSAVSLLLLGLAVQPGECQQSNGQQRPSSQLIAGKAEATIKGPIVQPPVTERGLAAEDYVIGEQDTLTITIWKEKDLSGTVVVRPDGKVTVPLVGEIKVVGMTPVQLQNTLTERLRPFITVPQVSVAVNQINSRKVYLIGQAMREGTFEINSSTTVLQIIAQAGGLRDFAKRKKIYILRQQGDKQLRYAFNYDNVIRGRNRDQNIQLQPGDTIVVP